MAEEQFTLPVLLPFRLDLTAWALRRRAQNSIDRWDGSRYSRISVAGRETVMINVFEENPSNRVGVKVTLHSAGELGAPARETARRQIQKMLGLDLDLQPFYALAEGDPVIGPLVRRFAGVKPPRFPDIFEALVNAIACQQVTLDLGILLLNRLAEKFGAVFMEDGTPGHAFPQPADLNDVPEDEIKQLGFSHQKARAIKELASGVKSGQIDLE